MFSTVRRSLPLRYYITTPGDPSIHPYIYNTTVFHPLRYFETKLKKRSQKEPSKMSNDVVFAIIKTQELFLHELENITLHYVAIL